TASGRSFTSGRGTWAIRCSTRRSARSVFTSATTGIFPKALGCSVCMAPSSSSSHRRPHAVSPCSSGSSSRPPTRSPTATGSGRSIASDRRRSSARTTTTARAISPIRAARSSRRRARRTSSFSSPTWTWISYARSATPGSSIGTAVPTCTTTWSSRSATSREASVSRLVYAPHGPDGLARPWSDYRDRRVRARPVTSRRPRHRRGAGRLARAPAAHVRPDSGPGTDIVLSVAAPAIGAYFLLLFLLFLTIALTFMVTAIVAATVRPPQAGIPPPLLVLIILGGALLTFAFIALFASPVPIPLGKTRTEGDEFIDFFGDVLGADVVSRE